MEKFGFKKKFRKEKKKSFSEMTCPVSMYSCVFVLSLFLLSGYKPAYVISVVQVMLFFKTMIYFKNGEIM